MNLTTAIEELEALPLLGPEKARAQALATQLSQRVNPDSSPRLALRVLIRRFLAGPSDPAALAQLSTAEAWATSEGLTAEATQIQLIWGATVGRSHPEAVNAQMLDEAIANAAQTNAFPVESLLAKATRQSDQADTLLLRAIDLMDHPRWVAQRFCAFLDLASARIRGADAQGGHMALQEALHIANEHSDPEALIVAQTRLGLLHLEQGQTTKAQPHFEAALKTARREEDDLNTVLNSSLLCAIYMNQDDWARAGETADGLLIAGARRANWFAVVDGHITRSTLLLLDGDTVGAISRLVRAAIHLRELVPAAAINVLKGRLAELRFSLGPTEFDRHYQAAMSAQQRN
jgi:tetratricopeptide (TPR) repeat protein